MLSKPSAHISPDPVFSLHGEDRKGYAAAYDRFYLPVYYFIQKFVADPHVAEDITADTFVKLWRQTQEPAPIHNVKAFLHTAARNACIDYLKAQQLHREKEKELYYLAEQDNRLSQQMADIKAELILHIQQEIEQLPSKARQIFELSFIEGLKNREIAQLLNLSEQTVLNQKTIAIKKLRFALQDKRLVWALLLLFMDNA